MYLYQLTEVQMIAFSLVFLRVLAFFVAMPIFSMSNIPVQVKILTSLVVAILMYPIVPFHQLTPQTLNTALILIVIREVFLGLILGYLTRLIFYAVNTAGQIISLSMGLSNSQIFNPAMGVQSTTIEQFNNTLAILFFFSIDGHHYFLKGLQKSFELLPVSPRFFSASPFLGMIQLSKEVIIVGLQLSMPVLLAILLMNVAMGIIGRAVPQINVLVTSLPLNVMAGFLVMLLSLPLFFQEMGGFLDVVTERLFVFMKSI